MATSKKATIFYDNGEGGLSDGHMILTKYEFTRICGLRREQLARGSIPLVEWSDDMKTVDDVLRAELRQRKLPFIVERRYPSGEIRAFRLRHMLLPHWNEQ